MINQFLDNFINRLDCTSSHCDRAFSEETSYAAMCGEFEKYIRWKFAHHIYKNHYQFNQDSISIESFDRTDMVFMSGNGNSEVNFIEWKGMTLPINGQHYSEFINNKWKSNILQLAKCHRKFPNNKHIDTAILNANNTRFWSLFVFVDFNDTLINQFQLVTKPFVYFNDGLFQKKYNIGVQHSHNNKQGIFGNANLKGVPLVLPHNLKFPDELRLIFRCVEIAPNSLTNASAHNYYWKIVKEDFQTLTHISLNLPSK